MGEKDTSVIGCLKDRRRFADLCNAKLYEGKQIIRPQEPELLDSKEALILPMKEGKSEGIHRGVCKPHFKRDLLCNNQYIRNYVGTDKGKSREGENGYEQCIIGVN